MRERISFRPLQKFHTTVKRAESVCPGRQKKKHRLITEFEFDAALKTHKHRQFRSALNFIILLDKYVHFFNQTLEETSDSTTGATNKLPHTSQQKRFITFYANTTELRSVQPFWKLFCEASRNSDKVCFSFCWLVPSVPFSSDLRFFRIQVCKCMYVSFGWKAMIERAGSFIIWRWTLKPEIYVLKDETGRCYDTVGLLFNIIILLSLRCRHHARWFRVGEHKKRKMKNTETEQIEVMT